MTINNPQNILEILTIGREILDGRVIDTNSVKIAEVLRTRGWIPRYAQKVDDDLERIVESFSLCARRSSVILITGGLGPTSDDLTAQAFAQYLGEELVLNPEAHALVKAKLQALNRPMTSAQEKQAYLPESCSPLLNPEGTAPGFYWERPLGASSQRQQWFFLPGVPREMLRMLQEQVLPRLPERAPYASHSWFTHFTAEANLQEKLLPIEQQLPRSFELTFRTRYPENHVGLHAEIHSPQDEKNFENFCKDITALLKDESYWQGSALDAAPTLEELVLERLSQTGALLGAVESCTGGLVSHRLTEIAGASRAFWWGEVVYDNAAKIRLGVSPQTLERHGAVSKETALELAHCGQALLKTLWQEQHPQEQAPPLYCVVTTGIAGPSGGTAQKPVGLCHLALALPSGEVLHEEFRARSALPRTFLKAAFSQKALDLVRRSIKDH